MRKIKSRMLSLLLTGIITGASVIPVMAETADASGSVDNTETAALTTDESTGSDMEDTGRESLTTDIADQPDNSDSAENTGMFENAARTPVENTVEELTEEIVIEPVTDKADEEMADTTETAENDVTILSDEVSSNADISVKVYGVDYFDAEYSSGYLCLSGGIPSGLSTPGDGEYKTSHGTPYKFANNKRSTGVSMTYYNGACMNGVYYDVREYLWIDSANTNCAYVTVIGYTSGSSKNYGSGNTGVYRELHFYKAGTLKSGNPEEVTFRGVLRFRDCDSGEGYSIVQGLQNIWLYPTTNIRRAGTTTWMGTETGEGESEVTTNCFWATVEGTPEEPLTICYVDLGGRSSQINYTGNKIQYNIIANDSNTLPRGVKTSASFGCATYSYYNLIEAEDYNYYEFDGWYYDKEMTNKAPDTVMVSTDMVFYGTYRKVAARVDTEVVGGTITEAQGYVNCGENVTIEYSPNNGYFLDTITVDGEQVDSDQFKDSYLFADIQDDHSIKVVYVKAEDPTKSVANTNGKDMDGQLTKAGETLVYTISVQNPALTTKTFKVTDNLPDSIEFVSADHDGTYANGTVTWSLDMAAGEKITLTVKAKAAKAGAAYANAATVIVGGIEMTTNKTKTWTVADPTKSVKDVDGNDVDGEFLVNGEPVTYIIAVKNPADDTRTFTITDKIPANMEFISADHDGKAANGVITWTLELNGGAEETVCFQAKATKAGAHYVNSANVTVENIKTTTNETSNWVMENPVKAVSLNSDDANGALVESGDELTYTITVKNPADKAVTAKVTDDLPDNTTFVSADNDGKEAAGTVTWRISLKGNETRTLTVVVKVQDGAKNSTLANTATVYVNGSTYETNETKSYVPTEPVKAVMQGSENIEGKTVEDGDEVKYTITVTNPADEKQDITVTDTVPDELEILKDDNSGKINGQKVTWTLKDVPAHTSKTVSITCEAIGTYSEQNVANKAQMTIDGHLLTSNKVQITIKAKEVEDTVITHKTINNETENNKIVNNTTVNNEVESQTTDQNDQIGIATGYRNVSTGDMAMTAVYIVTAVAAAIGLGIYYYKKRH